MFDEGGIKRLLAFKVKEIILVALSMMPGRQY
jgi:hypothetical protein